MGNTNRKFIQRQSRGIIKYDFKHAVEMTYFSHDVKQLCLLLAKIDRNKNKSISMLLFPLILKEVSIHFFKVDKSEHTQAHRYIQAYIQTDKQTDTYKQFLPFFS